MWYADWNLKITATKTEQIGRGKKREKQSHAQQYQYERINPDTLRADKKLILLVDLDETVITCTAKQLGARVKDVYKITIGSCA